ncbi:MAG: hypothetical protein ACREX4_21390 [Gammaproteobacteria bacterium]
MGGRWRQREPSGTAFLEHRVGASLLLVIPAFLTGILGRDAHPWLKKMRALMAQDGVDGWVTDVHFQQYGSRCQMCVPPEVTIQRYSITPSGEYRLFGAVRLRDGKFVFRRESDRFK